MNRGINQIAEKILESGNNVIFTGAGVSTESGIPDYRSQGGIWDKFKPVYFDEFMSREDARIEYWQRWQELYQGLCQATPNMGHQAIAELYQMGLIQTVVTQNIDGLHQASGIPDDDVIELHGNTLRIRCMSCSKISATQKAYDRLSNGDLAPACDCGGYLKPDTISFGQSMPMDKVNQAITLSQHSDLFIVVGSTLLVQPAAHMPIYAKQNNAVLAIINLSETPCDDMCDFLFTEKAGIALNKILEGVKLKSQEQF
ncbi:MAG: Sir2 family NAD-dependent protein deacetylase [Desulfobacterales bacterium]|nr:Sir2 family NAD-dependent protein deacetylase [Desulfobacterales bacterium]MDX2513135.1 Sir2 family NAD-dependent protein deacetylase [Desulfobacterales bacterium]